MDPARSFGSAADLYDRIRPSYPAGAVRWAIGDRPIRAVDLGHEVIPVEPDPGMRARLTQTCDVIPVTGSAEDIPVPDASVDAVLAGQAYHWFDKPRAHREIARVLRSAGRFAPIWNLRDETVPWVRELTRLADGGLDRTGATDEELTGRAFGDGFTPVERAEFHHSTTHTVESLLDLARSRSYYLTASPERRAAAEESIRDLVASHPDLAGRTTFELPYVTVTYRATRLR
jgi:SAM-dependent methyltransferase